MNFFDTAQATVSAPRSGCSAARSATTRPAGTKSSSPPRADCGSDGDDGLVRDSQPGMAATRASRRACALGVDHIDLYQVHWPDPAGPFAETAVALQELVDEGKIRHVGVSNFDAPQIAEFARDPTGGDAAAALPPVPPGYRGEILPYCREHDIGVLVYGPLAHGLLTGAHRREHDVRRGRLAQQSPLFEGETFRRNLEDGAELGQLRRRELVPRGAAGDRVDAREPRRRRWRSSAPAAPTHIEESLGRRGAAADRGGPRRRIDDDHGRRRGGGPDLAGGGSAERRAADGRGAGHRDDGRPDRRQPAGGRLARCRCGTARIQGARRSPTRCTPARVRPRPRPLRRRRRRADDLLPTATRAPTARGRTRRRSGGAIAGIGVDPDGDDRPRVVRAPCGARREQRHRLRRRPCDRQ